MENLNEQLLQRRKAVYPNCPGCKCAHRAKGAPPPYSKLFSVAVVVICNALPTCSLYPFLYFMVQDFHIAERDEDIGFYAGFIGSAFLVGRCLTSMHWGQLADKYGRRPIIIAGVFSGMVLNLIFGVSRSFWMALASRFLFGCFNGVLGPVKAYASELCSEDAQALAVAVVGTTWGVGLIIGPAIGGYLAQPAQKYPSLFPDGSLFAEYPYLLPAVVCSAACFVGMCIAFYLPETIHVHKDDKGQESMDHKLLGEAEEKAVHEAQTSEDTNSLISLLRNWPLMSAITLYCLWSLHDMAFTEILSLYCVSPRAYGGLGLTTTDVGNALSSSGLILLVFQLLLFPPIANRLGPIKVTRICAILALPVLAAYPWFSNFNGVLLKGLVVIATVLKCMFSVATLNGAFLLINNSVTASQRGAANGLSVSIVSLFKAVGPGSGGAIFSWSQSRHSQFLPGSQFVFFNLGLVALATAIWTFEPLLPSSLDKPTQDEEEDGIYVE